jgi:hypothetical protein
VDDAQLIIAADHLRRPLNSNVEAMDSPMYIDKNIDNEIFRMLRERGYTRPNLELGIWFKGNFFCRFTVEHRESARFDFGFADAPVDLRFPNSPAGWWRSKLKPYEYWLKALGQDASEFSQACGGWIPEGLRTPNFEKLRSMIAETLAEVEKCASNIGINRDADQRPLS